MFSFLWKVYSFTFYLLIATTITLISHFQVHILSIDIMYHVNCVHIIYIQVLQVFTSFSFSLIDYFLSRSIKVRQALSRRCRKVAAMSHQLFLNLLGLQLVLETSPSSRYNGEPAVLIHHCIVRRWRCGLLVTQRPPSLLLSMTYQLLLSMT